MENSRPDDKPRETPAEDESRGFIPFAEFRLALVVMMLFTGGPLFGGTWPRPQFYAAVVVAAAFSLALPRLGRRFTLPSWPVLAADLAFVCVMSYFSGGSQSPVRYYGIAYFYMHTTGIKSRAMMAAIVSYSVAVSFLMPLTLRHAADSLLTAARADTALNLLVINAVGWPAALIARHMQKERSFNRATASNLHAMTNALHLRTQNLQTALDVLTQAHEQLKVQDQRKTRFLSNVSHELRTPLSSIRSFSEILTGYDDLDRDTEKEFLGIITEESNRLSLLINDVLDMVKIESGNVERHMMQVDVSDVVAGSIKSLEPMAAEKGLTLEFEHPKARLPYVKGDKNQLTQVMVNLLNNAIKFTSTGGIRVKVSHEQEEVTVAVSDTGEGIYPGEAEKIFEEFYRVGDSLAGRPGGTGLGLAIVKKIIDHHGGRIWVDSRVGKGSTFIFTLPIDLEDFALAMKKPSAPRADAVPLRRRGGSILVLERNNIIRQALRKKLEEAGYVTYGASSGKDGLKMAMEEEFDLVVSGMLNYDGADTNFQDGFRAMARSAGVDVLLAPFIYNASYGLQVAANGFISRPIDRYELKKVIDELAPRDKGPFMVISPDRLEARTLQLLLGTDDYEVQLAEDRYGVEACRKGKPTLIFVDTSIPGDGWRGVLASLRAEQATCTKNIVLFTDISISLKDKNVSCVTLGRDEFVPRREMLFPLMGAIQRHLAGEGAMAD